MATAGGGAVVLGMDGGMMLNVLKFGHLVAAQQIAGLVEHLHVSEAQKHAAA